MVWVELTSLLSYSYPPPDASHLGPLAQDPPSHRDGGRLGPEPAHPVLRERPLSSMPPAANLAARGPKSAHSAPPPTTRRLAQDPPHRADPGYRADYPRRLVSREEARSSRRRRAAAAARPNLARIGPPLFIY